MYAIMTVLIFSIVLIMVKAFDWIMKKGSPLLQLIIALVYAVFCLLMAWSNNDINTLYTFAFALSALFYVWFGWKAFNKLVPTKE
jgi:amino acid permease